ncbi:hypothetical protein [Persicitalea jodogahamensis]|nr:hypothetical protein [Persicitalea jodogahamensis]
MKNVTYVLLFSLLFTAFSCQLAGTVQSVDPVIIDPIPYTLIGRDSISAGEYLGVGVNESAAVAYAAVQSLMETRGISNLNIVSNISSDLSQLGSRIPLYSYVLLDQKEGTDSGIQISLEDGMVKYIYLNSGEKLSQWPKNTSEKASIRLGDEAGELYEKLVRIKGMSQYARKFERISLQTKNLAAAFDPAMAQSPQWYFAYTTSSDSDVLERVKIHLANEAVTYIVVERYKK